MTIAVKCPNCSKPHDVPAGGLGGAATCQGCGRSFTLAGSQDETVAFSKGQATESVGPGKSEAPPRAMSGRYEIRERLGAGAFGTVYRAYDSVLDRDVAIKLPKSAVLESADARERFLREARAAGRLRHPHIVPVYDCGQDGDDVYIVAAFIEGQTLAAAIAAGEIDHRRSVAIAAKLAHALGTAHQAGIIHRDVKPANVMLDDRGEPQLTDFGLAQLSSSSSQLTQQGALVGTPAYMSPEQAQGNSDQVGPASDQFSLGVLLYELLCRRLPFRGAPLAVLYQVREETPPSPRSLDPTIPQALEAICLRAMAKRPADRFGDCAELSDALRQVAFDTAPVDKPPVSVQSEKRAPPKETEPALPKKTEPARPKETDPAQPKETDTVAVGRKSAAPPRPVPADSTFDPYHKWLAIPANERPPTHYQILGVTPRESDRDVINTAALQRSAYVRNFQSGKQSAQATCILNEIASALVCLLDPAKRAAYDAGLRKARPRAGENRPTAAPRAPAGEVAPALAEAPTAFPANSYPLDAALFAAAEAEPLAAPAWLVPPRRRRAARPRAWVVASAVGGIAVIVLVAMLALGGGDPPSEGADANAAPPATEGQSSRVAVAPADAAASESKPKDKSLAQPPSKTVASSDVEEARPAQEGADPRSSAAERAVDPSPAGKIVASTPPAVAVQHDWPADAALFQGHRYKVFYEQRSWHKAQAKCRDMGGHLPIVSSQEENAFLVQLFRRGLAVPQKLDGLWLGASDEAKEGAWVWVDGTPLTYRNWIENQPNNKQGSEHFLMLWIGQGGGWADQPNASTQHRAFYACEWDQPPAGGEATPVFNGRDLTGWDGDPALWRFENGAIVGQKPAGGQRDTYLATQASYGDFVLTTKFRLLTGNSGIQFRGELLPEREMTGYAADLAYHDNFKYLGWLFLVGKQGPCASPSTARKQSMIASLAVGGWNEYRVTANGNHIVLEINGVEVVNTTQDGPRRGRIGFQLHGGASATRVEFKDIEIRELPGG